MSRFVSELANPELVVRFQRLCGVEFVAEEEEEEGAAFSCDQDAADSRCHGADDTRLLGRCAGDARLRHARHDIADGNNSSSSSNNNNDKSDGEIGSPENAVRNGVDGSGITVKNGYVQNDHVHPDRSPDRNGVGTTNHPTTTQVRTTTTNNNNNINHRSPSIPNHDSSNGSTVKTNSSDPKHARRSNEMANGRVGKSATRVSIRYPVLYYWAKLGAFLGNEEFYLTVMPYLMWTVDSALIRQAGIVWWMVMYLGQATKDYMGWPRPPSPPVVRLETNHLAEFSMPSTHAMAGTAIPLVFSQLLLERYQLPVLPVLCVAALWCVTTCLSRLYLGVHTVIDVVCGILYALLVYVVVSPLMSRYDLYQQTHPLAPVVLVAASLALSTVCYPSSNKISAKADAITTTAVLVGVGLGAWLNYQLGFSHITPKPVSVPVPPLTLWWLAMSLLQFVVGVAAVFAVKLVVKPLTVRFFSSFVGLDRPDSHHPSVIVGYKYTTYMSLGLTMVFFVPMLFTALGFARPNYYFEVV